MSQLRARLTMARMIQSNIAADDCPLAPAPKVTVHTRVLHRACQKAGGIEKLAEYLHVSDSLLHRWLEGDDVPPSAIFLRALDLILPEWGPEDDAMARAVSAGKPKKKDS